MADPDIARLERDGAALARRAKSLRSGLMYADGPTHARDTTEADRLAAQASAKFAEARKKEKAYKRDVKLIRTGCGKLGLDEETRRGLYRTATATEKNPKGLSTLTVMRASDRRRVITELKARGFKPRPGKGRKAGRAPRNIGYIPPDIRAKVEAQLTDMGLPWGYAESILQRMRGYPSKVACPISGASQEELYQVMCALHYEQRKRVLLETIDRYLETAGQTRTELQQELQLRTRWERNAESLERAYTHLTGRDFKFEFDRRD